MRCVLIWLALGVACTGCLSPFFRSVQQEGDATLLQGTNGDAIVTPNTRVDPSTKVRLLLNNKDTPWLDPTLLSTHPKGVVLTLELAGPITQVRISGTTHERAAKLARIPAGRLVVSELDDGVVVRGDDARQWLTAAFQLGAPAAREVWRIDILRDEEGGRPTELYVSGGWVGQYQKLPATWVETKSWSEVHAFKANNLNGGALATMVPLSAAAVLLGVGGFLPFDLTVGVPATFSGFVNSAGIESGDPTDYADAWELTLPAFGGREYDVSPEPAQPLFSASARRRRWFRPQVELLASLQPLGGENSASTAVLVGGRIDDLFDVAAGYEAWWPAPFNSVGGVAAAPLVAGRQRFEPFHLATLRLGLAFDLDAERRWVVVGGARISAGPQMWRFDFEWGLQVKLVGGLHVTLRPFTAVYTWGWPATKWSYPSSLELGCSF